jgi:hypothetical protein
MAGNVRTMEVVALISTQQALLGFATDLGGKQFQRTCQFIGPRYWHAAVLYFSTSTWSVIKRFGIELVLYSM